MESIKKRVSEETVKGFRDYTGIEALKRQKIKGILADIFKSYGFELAETPVIEAEEFVRGENANDEAVSDVFKLEDKGKRRLALRYEFTFQLKRIANNKKLPYKRFQIGEVFRDEPTSANRFRQITQCDIDIVGSSLKDEAEILAIAKQVLEVLGIEFVIYVNNRKLINEILEKEGVKKENKLEVIREIDKLDKLPEAEVKNSLKKYGAEKVLEIFKKPEKYFEKYESFNEIKELNKFCLLYGVRTVFQPSLARGLSYYNGTIMEIKTKEMKESISGGGSFMINDIQSTGISFGIERLAQLAKLRVEEKKALIISLGEDKKAIELAENLRENNISCSILYGKISKALEYANSYGISNVIFIGNEEVKKKKFKLKDMKTGKEELLAEKELLKKL